MSVVQNDNKSQNKSGVGRSLPITEGRLADFSDDPISCMRKLYEQHGDIAVLREGGQDLVFTFGPRWNQRILTETDLFQSHFFATRGPKRSAQRRLTSGLLSMNRELHQRHRRIVMGPFNLKSIGGYFEPLVKHTEKMLAGWHPGEVRDIHHDMTRLMLSITSSILFGIDQEEEALSFRIGQMLEVWVEMNHSIGIGALVRDETFSKKYEELLAYSEQLEESILEMIHLRRDDSSDRQDVLSILIRTHDEQGGMTDEELIGQVAVLFGAAHMTTASSLTWTLLLLAQHPAVMSNVYDEIQTVMSGPAPSLSDLDKLECMDRVVKESMRILPASSYLPRIVAEPTMIGPIQVTPGTPVIFSQFITHHMLDLFDEPDRFQPDRWRTIKPSPYAYLPFAAGPRMCIGVRLSIMMFKVILPMIFSRFRLSALPGEEYGALVCSTMLFPSTPIKLQIASQDGCFQDAVVKGNINSLVDFPKSSAVVPAGK